MNRKTFYSIVNIIFLLILVLHLGRIIFGWSAVLGGVVIPVWASWIAVVLAGFIFYQGYKLRKQI